jgi:hypothetical protein
MKNSNSCINEIDKHFRKKLNKNMDDIGDKKYDFRSKYKKEDEDFVEK